MFLAENGHDVAMFMEMQRKYPALHENLVEGYIVNEAASKEEVERYISEAKAFLAGEKEKAVEDVNTAKVFYWLGLGVYLLGLIGIVFSGSIIGILISMIGSFIGIVLMVIAQAKYNKAKELVTKLKSHRAKLLSAKNSSKDPKVRARIDDILDDIDGAEGKLSRETPI